MASKRAPAGQDAEPAAKKQARRPEAKKPSAEVEKATAPIKVSSTRADGGPAKELALRPKAGRLGAVGTTHQIQTTQQPWKTITVSEIEYQQLLAQGLVYSGSPVTPAADFYDNILADKVANGSAFPAALGTEAADSGSPFGSALRAAFVHVDRDGNLVLTVGGVDTVVGGGGGGLTAEQVQDLMSTTLVAGANTTITYDDIDGTITIATTGSGGTVTSASITDATTVGRAVLTAADQATARTAIGAGTSSYTPPTQTGNAGKFLTTDGTSTSWGTPAGGTGVPVAPAAVKTPLRLAAALDTGILHDYLNNGATATNATTPLTTPTYDGSGQIAELDVLYFPEGWNGYRYWMANGPYPAGNTAFENPSLLVSQDGKTWSVPPGVTNPLFPMPAGGHNADPSLFCDTDGTMYLFWVSTPDGTAYSIKYVKSTDGVTWSAAADLIAGVLNGDSPAIIWTGTAYRFYYHWTPPSQAVGLYYSEASTVAGLGVPTTAAGFTGQSPGTHNWSHFDIRHYQGRYYILFSDTNSLYLGASRDGASWTVNTLRSLGPGASGAWDAFGIYRTSFVIAETASGPAFDLWYAAHSGATPDVWGVGYARMLLATPSTGSSGGSVTFSGAKVVPASSPNVATASATPLPMGGTEAWDTDAYHDTTTNNSRLTVPAGKDGYFSLRGQVSFPANTTGIRQVYIRKNGLTSSKIGFATQPTTGTGAANVQVFGDDLAVAGEYYELVAYQDSGGTLGMVVADTWFSIERKGS